MTDMFVLLGCADTQKYMARVCHFLTKTRKQQTIGSVITSQWPWSPLALVSYS